MNNPYSDINWQEIEPLQSLTHAHLSTDTHFRRAYDFGLRHWVIHDYNETRHPPEDFFDMTQEEIDNVISVPSSEHADGSYHYTPVGSDFDGGRPYRGGWKLMMEEYKNHALYDHLLITFNHPLHYGIEYAKSYNHALEFFDHDPIHHRGIEVFNTGEDRLNMDLWDDILRTGRQMWGHTVPDHEIENNAHDRWKGHHFLLLPPNPTEAETVKAYQKGEFFCSLLNTGLKFTKIEEDEGSINVELNDVATIKFISENGTEKEVHSDNASFTPNDNVFIRVQVEKEITDSEREGYMDEYNEMLFSQPIMYKPIVYKDKRKEKIKKLLLL